MKITVRVPATSANLGPGFDCLGLALASYDEVIAEDTGNTVAVEVSGEGAGTLPGDRRHLVARTVLDTLRQFGVRPPGLTLRCRNAIPQARGMGSSAAAIVAGVLIARELLPPGAIDEAGALDLAARTEGHGDNVAACLLGGIAICYRDGERFSAVRFDPVRELSVTLFVPAEKADTRLARALLPATVPMTDAVHNLSRSALLVHALRADPARLLDATADRLHQDYRAASMPASAALVSALRAAGIPAVISGAGPAVLAFGSPRGQSATPVHWPDPGPRWATSRVAVERAGASVRTG